MNDGKFEFRAPAPAHGRARAAERAAEPAAAAPGHRPAALPGGRHVGRAGQGGPGPGLGRRAQAGARRHRAREDPLGRSCPARRRPGRPGQDVRRPGVRRHRRALPTQAEVDAGGEGARGADRGRVGRVRGRARGNPKIRAGTAITIDNLGGAVRRQVRAHVVAAQSTTRTTGYQTSFTVSGRQARSLFGLVRRRARRRAAPASAIAQVSDVDDPEHQGRVKVTFPWLSDDYVSDWARTAQPGAGKDGAC